MEQYEIDAYGKAIREAANGDCAAPTRRPHEREIFRRGGRYVVCQVMNWQDGPPPKYLVCNPLSGPGAGIPFLATQGMGTWMEPDIYELASILNSIP